ncbi:hypothetical protein BU16DRAFT_382243 [Lophium mytilinum]|uniref:Uncharacterized protein n=1 Tax=Lophium mytilinum TaxID=390894 RepID=A0A6A6QST8_9PEZI|nr:hypothetical protein BU16DRAFT_382243 [Lophium mytilinum]
MSEPGIGDSARGLPNNLPISTARVVSSAGDGAGSPNQPAVPLAPDVQCTFIFAFLQSTRALCNSPCSLGNPQCNRRRARRHSSHRQPPVRLGPTSKAALPCSITCAEGIVRGLSTLPRRPWHHERECPLSTGRGFVATSHGAEHHSQQQREGSNDVETSRQAARLAGSNHHGCERGLAREAVPAARTQRQPAAVAGQKDGRFACGGTPTAPPRGKPVMRAVTCALSGDRKRGSYSQGGFSCAGLAACVSSRPGPGAVVVAWPTTIECREARRRFARRC